MAVITAAALNSITDPIVRYYLRLLGNSTANLGVGIQGGSWGASGAVQDMGAALQASGDLDPIAAMISPIQNLILGVSGSAKAASDLSPLLSALQGHVIRYQLPNVRTLDDFLTYQNTALVTKWQTLQAPGWRDLVGSWLNGSYPSIQNLYFEVLQGVTYAQGLGGFVVGGAFTGGFAVDGTKYAGGFPQVRASGVTGSGVVTVTGTAFDPATNTATAGKTWTATVNANGVFALTPGGGSAAPANSLIAAVSGISAAAGLTAGTLYVEAARPGGRPLLP